MPSYFKYLQTLLSSSSNLHNATANTVLEIHDSLLNVKAEKGLEPGDDVNRLFSELVGMCVAGYEKTTVDMVMNDVRIRKILPSLRQICADGEALLEMHSVKTIIGERKNGFDSEAVFKRLQAFPYYQNYIELTRLELAALYAVTSPSSHPIRNIAFIGSGPLPLSSLCLRDALNSESSPFGNQAQKSDSKAHEPLVSVMNIDRDHDAIEISKELCLALGLKGKGMEFLCTGVGMTGDSSSQNDSKGESKQDGLQGYDVVFLAALVGENQEAKEKIVEEVAATMREGSILIVRSADGMRGLLYPEFDHTTARLRAVFDVETVLHPQNQVVNSVIAGRVKGREIDV